MGHLESACAEKSFKSSKSFLVILLDLLDFWKRISTNWDKFIIISAN